MKFHLIAALFLAALVAVPSCFAEEETPKNDAPMANGQLLGAEDPNPPIDGVPQPGDEQDEETDENDEAEEDETDLSSIPEELRDEVQEAMKRRVRHRLSARCCNILKYYRLCSNHIIRKLCPRQCRPICKNLLSWQSCNRVRKLRKCRHHIGRFYCKQSCGYCRKPTPRPKRWVTKINFWCGVKNRRLLATYRNAKVKGTLKSCQALCLKTRGCRAVERWGKYNFNCYWCLNYKLMKPYTNKRDLAYPATVSYYV